VILYRKSFSTGYAGPPGSRQLASSKGQAGG